METDRREGQIVECSCCGSQRDTVALASRDDVRLCRDCVEWLSGKLGIVSTPTLPVRDLNEAIDFYERAGFGVRAYKEDEDDPGDGFAFVDYAGQSVFDLDVVDVEPAQNHAGCYLIVPDPDGWHFRLAAGGLPVTALEDQPWGMREFTLTDPSGNNVRIGQSIG
jgi:catechol 2,3-dioxygenase-like lactoylglutathione lyase family enzyme